MVSLNSFVHLDSFNLHCERALMVAKESCLLAALLMRIMDPVMAIVWQIVLSAISVMRPAKSHVLVELPCKSGISAKYRTHPCTAYTKMLKRSAVRKRRIVPKRSVNRWYKKNCTKSVTNPPIESTVPISLELRPRPPVSLSVADHVGNNSINQSFYQLPVHDSTHLQRSLTIIKDVLICSHGIDGTNGDNCGCQHIAEWSLRLHFLLLLLLLLLSTECAV